MSYGGIASILFQRGMATDSLLFKSIFYAPT